MKVIFALAFLGCCLAQEPYQLTNGHVHQFSLHPDGMASFSVPAETKAGSTKFACLTWQACPGNQWPSYQQWTPTNNGNPSGKAMNQKSHTNWACVNDECTGTYSSDTNMINLNLDSEPNVNGILLADNFIVNMTNPTNQGAFEMSTILIQSAAPKNVNGEWSCKFMMVDQCSKVQIFQQEFQLEVATSVSPSTFATGNFGSNDPTDASKLVTALGKTFTVATASGPVQKSGGVFLSKVQPGSSGHVHVTAVAWSNVEANLAAFAKETQTLSNTALSGLITSYSSKGKQYKGTGLPTATSGGTSNPGGDDGNSGPNGGAIAGGIIGGLAAVGLGYFLWKKKFSAQAQYQNYNDMA